jgi:hypothetical protein
MNIQNGQTDLQIKKAHFLAVQMGSTLRTCVVSVSTSGQNYFVRGFLADKPLNKSCNPERGTLKIFFRGIGDVSTVCNHELLQSLQLS